MLHDVESHKFQYIIFTKLDRWFRNISDFYKIQEILDNNGATWLTALEHYEMETTNGRLNVNIRLSVAQDEVDRDSDRIKDVFRLKVKKREAIIGSLPIGLMVGEDGKVAIDPDNVQIPYDIFDYFELHNSKRDTLLYLINKYNRYFCYETISRTLRNPLYKGEYRSNPDYCPKIIDPARFDRIQVLAKRNVVTPEKKDLSHIRTFLKTNLQAIYDTLTPQEKRALWSSIIDKIIVDNDGGIEIVFL